MLQSRVFLSYSSSLGDTAARIELALKGEGFSVFRDRSALPPGESFDDRIRSAIEDSDLFVFLVTPEAVLPGRYTLTELKFAEQKWPHPRSRVLPVIVEATPMAAIPAYLRAVTMLTPRGNLVAEVAAEVARMGAPWWRRMLQPKRLVPTVAAVLLTAGGAVLTLPPHFERQQQNARAEVILQQSMAKADRGDHAAAWALLKQAAEVAPASRAVFEAQEALAMRRLRHTGVASVGGRREHFEDLLTETWPALSRGAQQATGERLANLLAHMGWADHLRGGSAESGGLDPAQRYRGALDIDPGNVYAHTMWGYELLRQHNAPEALAKAKAHFAVALQSGQERPYLRLMQVSAWLQTASNAWVDDPARHREALQVANDMRTGGEAVLNGWGRGSFANLLWPIYHFGFIADDQQVPLLGALPPAAHLALFRWLFPEDELAAGQGGPSLFDYLYARAQVEEYGGDTAGAVASYRRLLGEFDSRQLNAARAVTMADKAKAAVQRLDP